jgi:hypothetical protein
VLPTWGGKECTDHETFGRVYINRERAEKFAERQKKSPVVLKTRIQQLS